MLFLSGFEGGGKFVLPLVCVLALAIGTLITGVIAARKGTPVWLRAFWGTMALFLLGTAALVGILSHWIFALVLLLPACMFILLLRAGKTGR